MSSARSFSRSTAPRGSSWRGEAGVAYTIFSDSTVAIGRSMADRGGSGQAPAKAIIELEELLTMRGCSVAIRWTPTHRWMEGNEMADSYAKWAAEAPHDTVGREYVREVSFAHLTPKTTEARSQRTRERI